MARFRLRLHSTEINLPTGELLIGRGPQSFLRINEPMVSRDHARLTITNDRVFIEDLNSRNGTHVNGVSVGEALELMPGDLISIGSQQFTLEIQDEAPRHKSGERSAPPADSEVPVHAGSSLSGQAATGSAISVPANPSGSFRRPSGFSGSQPMIQVGVVGRSGPQPAVTVNAPPQVTAPHTALTMAPGSLDPPSQPGADFAIEWPATTAGKDSATHLFWGLSDKILAMGRVDEAERMMGPKLQELLRRAEVGHAVDPAVIPDALRRSLRLAAATRKDVWFAWMFEYARACRCRMEPLFLDEIYAQMFTCRPAVSQQILSYAQILEDEAVILRLVTLRRLCRE